MLKTSPAYLLGGTSIITTIITTILNGLCYGISKSSTRNTSPIEAATLALGIIGCIAVLALLLAFANAPKLDARTPRRARKAIAFGAGTGYLTLAAAASAGAIAWSSLQLSAASTDTNDVPPGRSLLVARCIIWAISVLTQGMFCGALLTSPNTSPSASTSQSDWPTLVSYELNGIASNIENDDPAQKEVCSAAMSVSDYDSQRPSLDTITPPRQSASASASASVSRTTSYRSARYSGRTLTQADSARESLDSNPTTISVSRPESPACTIPDVQEENIKPQPQPQAQRQPLSQRASSQIKRSLDSVMLRPTSSLSAPGSVSMAPPELPAKAKRPLRLKVPDESNIHPLFRSCSLSPPMATPTSMVLASPEAGQTIDKKALQRMRSSREIRPRASWRRSPLFEQTDHLFEDRPDENRPVSVLSYNSFGSQS